MKLSLSYSEISALLNSKTKMSFTLSYQTADRIRVTFIPHSMIGQISIDMRFHVYPSAVLGFALASTTPGVNSIVSGFLSLLANRPNAFPYIDFSEKVVKVDLKKIPQLSGAFKMISISSIDATSSGLTLNVNI